MKKKHIKFKPLEELYDHGHNLFKSKVESQYPDKSQVSIEEVSGGRKNHWQLASSEASTVLCTSCQSSYSEEFQSLEYLKAFGHSEDFPMLPNETTSQTTDVFDCQADNSSCISKDDGAIMISSDHFDGADHKNVSSSAPSVSSSCPDVVEKCLNGQTIRIGSPTGLVEEADKSSTKAHNHSSEVELPAVCFSDELALSETSLRDECDSLDHKINEKPCVLANTQTGLSNEYPSATVSNNSDGNEHLKYNPPITSTQEPHLQTENIVHGNGSEEMVDVRVCDICGDVGREALLVLCSKCNDGAEHIYCMTPKMDKVPEGDWLCEECMLTCSPKRPRQAMVESSDRALQPSYSNEPSQGSPTIDSAVEHAVKRRKNRLSEPSCLSYKRLGSVIYVRSDLKKISVARSVQPLKVSGSGMKRQATHVSSLKSFDKGKDPARQVSSFVDLPAKKVVKQTCSSDDRSPIPEQKFCGGSLNNGRPVNSSDSNMEVRRSCFVYQRRNSAKENGYGETKKGPPDKTVVKSLSSTGGASIPMDVSNAQSSVSTAKGPRFGSAKNSNEKIYTVANKTNQVLSVGGSSPMKVSSSRTTMGSKIFKVATSSKRVIEGRKGIQADGNANGKGCGTLAPEDKDVANQLAVGSVEERKSPCNVRYAINSSARNVNANCDQGLNLSTQNSKFDNIALDKNDHSVASYEILPFDYKHMKVLPTLDREDIDHMVPLTISAVPESRCIWKGTFKLEKSGELPTDCYGVQAHLSTRASSKVAELVHGFSPEMLLKEVPRSHTWPVQFQKNHPTEQDIALYFFAQDLWSYGRSYRMLLDIMTNSDLALEGSFGGFQLLIFPSSLLPARSQCWNTLAFLWGVFRARKVDGCTLSPHSLNTETLNQGLNSTVTFGSEGKFVPTPVGGSAFVSRTSHNSMQGPESAGPEVLQSPALVESEDQVIEYEEPSLEKHIVNLQKHHVQADSATFTHAWRKEDSGWSIHNDDLQKGNRVSDEDMKSTNKVDVVQHDQTTREQTSSFGFCYDGNYEIPGLIRFNDSASEPWQRHDVASGISFSLDSGPSGSSDGGGSAKSADESQVEPSRSYDDLNLNLCLGNGSDSEAKIDLDLVLGIPTQSKYKRKHFLKDGSYQDGNVSLVLSLGMPCSTSSAV